ncbi:MAG: NAD(P)-binding domain-containing protein [Myxococcota bacterium]
MKDACVIGAGSSGIAAIKVLKERGISFDCFETGSGIGGNWRFMNDNGMSSAYRSLHINTSKRLMAFSDYPMPDAYPDYPHHSEVLSYFESYVDHFGLREHITFQTAVERVRATQPGYEVDTSDGETRRYRAVLVANGHHWDAVLPNFEGRFDGETMHSHDYKTPHCLVDKRVLVVGIGNSAVDIACEGCRVARRLVLSTRRSAHIFPKYMFGVPTDSLIDPRVSRLPFRLQVNMAKALLRITQGEQTRYGMPLPDHSVAQAHPTISDELLHLVGHGRIEMKPNVQGLEADGVAFVDGTRDPFDLIIFATGYRVSFPFLDRSLFSPDENDVSLYLRVVPPNQPNLYFIGLVQPLGAIMPIAEEQSKWVARLLRDELQLPSRAVMEKEIQRYKRDLRRRYVKSRRHTIQVDFHPYLRTLRGQSRAGLRR